MPEDKKVFDLDSEEAFPEDIAEIITPKKSKDQLQSKVDPPKDTKQRDRDIVKVFASRRSLEIGVMSACAVLFVIAEICAWVFKLAIAWKFVAFFVPYLIWIITSSSKFRCPKCNTWLVKFREGEGGLLWKIKQNGACAECGVKLINKF